MGRPEEIISLYLDDDKTRALLIDGPDDGMELELRGPARPLLMMPESIDFSTMLAEDDVEARIASRLLYVMEKDEHGLPRRDDAGMLTYRFAGRQ